MSKECGIENPSDIDCLRCGAEGCNERTPMRNSTDGIFAAVYEAMQHAEDMGGPEDNEYIELMNRIITEATTRRNVVMCRTCSFNSENGCIVDGPCGSICMMRMPIGTVEVKIIKG